MTAIHSVCRHLAALVSHRWNDRAHAPELCRQISLTVLRRTTRHTPSAPSVLCSFAAWLMRHGQHVCHLQLGGSTGHNALSQEEQAQLTCCLMACAGGQLQTLHAPTGDLIVAAWAPVAMRSLRQLQLGSTGAALDISSSLHSLTQLTLLFLAGRPVRFSNKARLPASVRRLQLADTSSTELPSQAQRLSMPGVAAA